jgi:MarR family transcriptional regulator, organic hydroperoxide resistance regulator
MKNEALDFCEQLLLAHGSLARKLDDELGTHHGLSMQDFLLLRLLVQSPEGCLPVAALTRPLGKQPSAVIRQLLPLEKTGLVQREPGRGVVLRSAGRALVNEAALTAEHTCAKALWELPRATLDAARPALQALVDSPALELR